MILFQFERPARQDIKWTWGHGRYLDPWSIVHFLSGALCALLGLVVSAELWQTMTTVLVGAFVYELFESRFKIVEDVENSLSDVALALAGVWAMYFLFSAATNETLVVAFAVLALSNLSLLYLGWRFYLRAHLGRVLHKQRSLKAQLRDNILFFGFALASIPLPYLVEFEPIAAGAWVVAAGLIVGAGAVGCKLRGLI